MSDNKKKYNLTLSRAYAKSNGFWSVDIGVDEYEAIQTIKPGGRLVLQVLKEESRKNEKSPQAYFQYMTPEEVKDFKAKSGSRGKPTTTTATTDDSDY